MKMNKLTLIALAIGFIFTACTSDDTTTPVAPRGDYENGILISEEGNFTNGNGAVSYLSNDLSTLETTIYQNVNGELLGNTVQSMAFNGDLAYIIANGSDEIEVVNRYTFESVATITSTMMDNPRYMAFSNGKGYVTNWGDFGDATDDKVLIIDLASNTVSGSIATSYLPEDIIANNNTLYVTTGIFSTGDKVDVINTATDALTTSITVGNSPNSIQFDGQGDIWVLSSENLIKINASNNVIAQTLTVSGASKLYYSGGDFYYYASNGIYKMSDSATDLPTDAEFTGVNLYDFSVRNNQLFGLDNNSFSGQSSTLRVYDLTTNTETNTFNLGPFAGEVYFN